MQRTLTKVKNLEKFIKKHGEDIAISRTITKMLEYKVQEYSEEINRLNKELKKFERKFNKGSSAFYDRFSKGRLGDDMDYIEWASLYQMRNRLVQKKDELEGIK